VHGLINLDFADVKTVMSHAGSALMGIGRASGDDRAVEAAHQAIESPLLEVSIDGARGILFNVIGGLDMSMHEINAAAEVITAAADPDANIIFGATINPELEGEIIITVVATGFDSVYYSNRQHVRSDLAAKAGVALDDDEPLASLTEIDAADKEQGTSNHLNDDDIKSLDMALEEKTPDPASELKDETPLPNIWSFDADEVNNEEDKFDKPSFLRRLKRRKKDDVDEDKKE
jgi:cell division protein FtsZ